MRLRRALGYAALGIGAAAVTNAALEREAGDLHPALSGRQRTFRWRGMNVAYTEKGDTSDPTMILLHGVHAAASSVEWGGVFDDLSGTHHVVAPDLPGFGRSERPPLRYSAALYEDFLSDFLADFDEPCVVASSLTGAYAVAAAGRADIDRLVLVCPTATAGPRRPKAWLHQVFRLPVVGEALFNGLASRPSIKYFEGKVAGGGRSPDPERLDYYWRTAHQKNARFAPAAFVSGSLNSELDLAGAIADLGARTTLVWGRDASQPPLSTGRELAADADCGLVVFDDSRLLPHLDWPDQFAAVLRDEVTGGEGRPTDEAEEDETEPGEPEADPAEDGDSEFEFVEDADAVSVESRGDGGE